MGIYHVVNVDKPDWSAIEKVELHHQPWLADNGVRAWAQACHDGERIHVRMTAKEEKIRATLTEPLDAVCTDSCMEFFFAPDMGDERYINFEWNPLSTLYLGFGGARNTRMRLIVKDKDELFAPKPFETEDGWGIEFSIPVSFIRQFFPNFAPVSGGSICANFYKCGDQTPKRHYLCWNEVASVKPDFHLREYFGTLYFE